MAKSPDRPKVNDLYPINGQEAANMLCQKAFLKSKGNGAKMAEMLRLIADVARPRRGGAFRLDTTACHPNVPGCNYYMAQWLTDFHNGLVSHIEQIRTDVNKHPFPYKS